jgi:hypothetical protein
MAVALWNSQLTRAKQHIYVKLDHMLDLFSDGPYSEYYKSRQKLELIPWCRLCYNFSSSAYLSLIFLPILFYSN